MANLPQFMTPMVGRGTRFDTNQTRGEPLEKGQQFTARQTLLNDNLPIPVDAVNLKN